jgi:hypothetical protein
MGPKHKNNLRAYYFHKKNLLYLNDVLILTKEISVHKGAKRSVLIMQRRVILNKIKPKYIQSLKKGGSVEEAIHLYKAILIKDTMNLRVKYFEVLAKL